MTQCQFARRSVIIGIAAMPLTACSDIRKPSAAPLAASPAKQPQPSVSGLSEITAVTTGVLLDLRYATENNFTGRVLYSQARAFLQEVAKDALMRAGRRAIEDGFGITIFDAYRPWRVTKALWDATPPNQRNYVANPKNGSRHNRGCAVDLSLHVLDTGRLVEMPSAFDDFSERAHRDFITASTEAMANRERLERYMEAEGFIGMSNEWWHFDYRDWRDFPVLDLPFEDL